MDGQPCPANSGLRMLAGSVDALIAFALLPMAPALLWVAANPEMRYWQGARIEWRPELLVICYALYSLLCHWRWRKTLGKALCGLSVIHVDGSEPVRSTLVGREVIRSISLGLLSIPLVLSISLWLDRVAREWAGNQSFDYYANGIFWLYTIFAAPIVSAVILCPILLRKRGFHDLAADTQVVQRASTRSRTPSEASGQPIPEYLTRATLFLAGVPVLLLVAFYAPNGYVFLGILLAFVLGYLAIRRIRERRNKF